MGWTLHSKGKKRNINGLNTKANLKYMISRRNTTQIQRKRKLKLKEKRNHVMTVCKRDRMVILISGKTYNIWKLKTLLHNQWVKKEITK